MTLLPKLLGCESSFDFLVSATILKKKKAMATHSRTLAWKIPWTEESGRLQSMGLLRVGHEQLHFHFHYFKEH